MLQGRWKQDSKRLFPVAKGERQAEYEGNMDRIQPRLSSALEEILVDSPRRAIGPPEGNVLEDDW